MIAEQLGPATTAREEQVGIAVVVEVAPAGADGGEDALQSRFLSDVGKCAVTIVMEQAVLNRTVEHAAQIVSDEKIQMPVAIVIHPRSSVSRPPALYSGLLRHVGEGAVSVVVIEAAIAVVEALAGDEQILKAIVVVVPGHNDKTVDAFVEARLNP